MRKFTEGMIVKCTAGTLRSPWATMVEGSLHKVIMRTRPSNIKLCNGHAYHEKDLP